MPPVKQSTVPRPLSAETCKCGHPANHHGYTAPSPTLSRPAFYHHDKSRLEECYLEDCRCTGFRAGGKPAPWAKPQPKREEDPVSYRCEICDGNTKPGQQMLRHVIYKPDGNIAREMAVCGYCKTELDGGMGLDALARRYRERRDKAVTVEVTTPSPALTIKPSVTTPAATVAPPPATPKILGRAIGRGVLVTPGKIPPPKPVGKKTNKSSR